MARCATFCGIFRRPAHIFGEEKVSIPLGLAHATNYRKGRFVMAIPKSSIKKRGRVFYLHFSENRTRRRVSLHTDSIAVAKERQRQFDSARARGELSRLPTKTPLAEAVTAYVAHMKATRTTHGYTADLSYLRNAFGPICDVLRPRRRCPNSSPSSEVHDP